jgi:predicted acyl esterase
MSPGKTYALTVKLPPIAYEFAAGHRIGLHISSSNFPRLERNLNTGGNNFDESGSNIAINAVHMGSQSPSRMQLIVLGDRNGTDSLF